MTRTLERCFVESARPVFARALLMLLPRREKQFEAGDAVGTADMAGAVVQLHDRRHDRQAQAVGLGRAFAGFIDPVEAFEQP
ncbi:hypothetical protein D3C81_968380 [compost metagenome]